jgi:adenylate cyclase
VSEDEKPRRRRRAGTDWQRVIARKVVESLQERDPDGLQKLYDAGLVKREWVEHPERRTSTAPAGEAIERLLQRSVESKPSLLTQLGLSAVQVISTMSESGDVRGRPSRLSIVFTDLEGFSAFTEKEGDEAATGLLAMHQHEVEPLVRARGGNIVKRLGDGFLLTFPHPEAAVMAGLELVEAQPEPLRLRAGVHTGDVMATADDIIGHVVNVAARVTESASGGEVVATVTVRDAVPRLPRVVFSPPTAEQFHGLSEAVNVCRVSCATD